MNNIVKTKSFFSPLLILLVLFFFECIYTCLAAGVTQKRVCIIKSGRQKEQLSNYTMEGGMPFSPVSMASNGEVFFFSEPHRFRISCFNSKGSFLYEVKNEVFKDAFRLLFTRDNKLVVVLNNSETSMSAWIYDIDLTNTFKPIKKPSARIVPAITNPGLKIYSIEYISSCSVLGIQTESGALVYNTKGKFLRKSVSLFLDQSKDAYILDNSKDLSILVYNQNNRLINTWIPPYFKNLNIKNANPRILRINSSFFITWYSIEKRTYQYYKVFSGFSGGSIVSSQELPIDFNNKFMMHIPYPPGDIEINEFINE